MGMYFSIRNEAKNDTLTLTNLSLNRQRPIIRVDLYDGGGSCRLFFFVLFLSRRFIEPTAPLRKFQLVYTVCKFYL